MLSNTLVSLLPYRLKQIAWLYGSLSCNGTHLLIPVLNNAGEENLHWKHSWATQVFRQYVPSTGTFLDVGANLGQTLLAVQFACSGVTYIGFEPNPRCVVYLDELIRVNNLANYLLLPIALSDTNGCKSFYRQTENMIDASATLRSDLRPRRENHVQTVPCFRYDDIAQDFPPPSFIKIDVEGAELEVITGMSATLRKWHPPILCEVLFTDASADIEAQRARNEALMSLLQSMSYTAYQIIKSPGLDAIVTLRSLDEFPSERWSLENKNYCDYVFLPTSPAPTGSS